MSQTKMVVATLFTSVLVGACAAEPAKPSGDGEGSSASSTRPTGSAATPGAEDEAADVGDVGDSSCYTQCTETHAAGVAAWDRLEGAWREQACRDTCSEKERGGRDEQSSGEAQRPARRLSRAGYRVYRHAR